MAQLHSVKYWLEILYIVSLKEGVYESIQPSSTYPGLTQKTIKEAWEIQKSRKAPNVTAAIGRYQYVGKTSDNGAAIRIAAEGAGLNWETDLFSPINQDKMAVHKIEGFRKVTEQLIRENPVEAAKRLAMEWASLPVLAPTQGAKRYLERGQSYYTGDGLNRAGVTPEQVEGAFARFLRQQPALSSYGGIAAAGEDPALTAPFGNGGDNAPTYAAATYNPVVTQRDVPLLSLDELLDLLRPENRVQNIPSTTPRITSQQFSDDRTLDYKANLYSSRSYKQTLLPPRDSFWGIVTDVVTIAKEELSLRSAQDLMVTYALINKINQPLLETIAYVYPITDAEGNPLEYLPEEQDPRTLAIDRSMKFEAFYDRLSIGTDISSKIEKDSIVKVRLKGPNRNMARIVGVIGSPSTIFANLIGGSAGGGAGAPYGAAGSVPGQLNAADPNSQSPPGRIVGPVGETAWIGEQQVTEKTEKTYITDICDMSAIPYLAVNIVYYYGNNFTGAPITGYQAPKAWSHCNYIKNFYRAAKAAYDKGYGIIVYDGYRPHDAQRGMAKWADSIGKPCLYKGPSAAGGCGVMIRNPDTGGGSYHNKGAAFDVAMYRIPSNPTIGLVVQSEDFGGPFDNVLEPETAAYAWSGASEEQKKNRALLRSFMTAGGFDSVSNKWWHFEIKAGREAIRGESGWIK